MPFEKFDRSKLNILPLNQRIHDVDLNEVYKDPATHTPDFTNKDINDILFDYEKRNRRFGGV